MIQGFWQNLSHPIIGLAPMDGVTDAAFRYITAKYGKPGLIITEFTSAEGIRAGAVRLFDDFFYSEIERPIVAQLFGADPAAFYVGALAVSALGFNGIDINMGCPTKNVTEKGAGAALILDPERAKAIIKETRRGTEAWSGGMGIDELPLHPALISSIKQWRTKHNLDQVPREVLPVSVKTRIGYDKPVISEWISHLLETEPVNISLHGRTLKQLYTGQADWEVIAQAADLAHQTQTSILGNGDIQDLADARQKISTFGVDGVLIGRAVFGNPWLFQDRSAAMEERLQIALEHARYLHAIFPGKGFIRIRKHLMDYTKGIEGAKDLRNQLMRITTLAEVESILADRQPEDHLVS